nr:DUF2127 domain-containing protein [Actinokineospora enzanensis]
MVLKGADGGIQLVCGIVLALVPPMVVSGLVHALITRDLVGDPDGSIAHHLEHATQEFVDGGTRAFAIFYLVLHGIIKLALVVALLRKIRWAYPVAAVVLAAFVVYEVYRSFRTGSVALPVFAAIDVVVIWLVLREYRKNVT